MADTMTLEKVRDSLRDVGLNAGSDYKRAWAYELADAIDAAIRERDELRGRLDSALDDRITEFRRANDESRRADNAEAELAALRKRIADSHRALIAVARGNVVSAARLPGAAAIPGELNGRIVRLLVEDDDA